MTQEAIDYSIVLADLEAKRDALTDAIEGIRKMLAISGVVTSANGVAGSQSFTLQDIPENAFHGLNIGDAAVKLLTTAKKPLSTKVIAESLERGGFRHTSKAFVNTVNTALYRMYQEDDPIVVKQGREWGLRTWYPGWRRPKGKDAEAAENAAAESETEIAAEAATS
jgi:hypothetical protein